MDLDSALLRAFVSVAEELHFGHAAARLFISQQALSKRIARLEGLLGVRLLDRRHRRVALTAAGERLLPEARRAVDAVDAVRASARGAVGGAGLTVDVLDEHLAMMALVRSVSQVDPGLDLSVVTRGSARSVLEMLRTGVADIALGRPGPVGSPWPTDLRGAAVLAEPVRLLVPAGHRLDRPEGVPLGELAGEPLWFPTVGAPAEWTELLTELVETFGLTVDRAGSTFGFDHWVGQVARGDAPVSFVGGAMGLPPGLAVSVVPLLEPTPVFWWWAVWRRRLADGVVADFLRGLASAASGPESGGDLRRSDRDRRWLPVSDEPFRS